jgi:mutator protein MutT
MSEVKTRNEKPHFHVAAGLLWENGKLLITKRPKGVHLEGFWEFPGGKQEEGETLEKCLKREISEELGIRVRVEDSILTLRHEYDTKVITLHVFKCARLHGEPRSLEHQEIRWVDPSDLKAYAFPPPDLKVLRFLFSTESSWNANNL